MVKFKKSDFADLWERGWAAKISPALVEKVVNRANDILRGKHAKTSGENEQEKGTEKV